MVPDSCRNEFHTLLARDVELGAPNWIVETRTPIFRLVIDLDADLQIEVTESDWFRVYRCVQSSLSSLYPGVTPTDRRVVVCSAKPKSRSKDGVPVIKSGRHLVFPGIYVNTDLALRIRTFLLCAVADERVLESCDVLCGAVLEDLFDRCVYDRNGFRMLYSRKASRCNDCDVRRRQARREEIVAWRAGGNEGVAPQAERFPVYPNCERCMGGSFVDEGRPYSPCAVYSGDMTQMGDYLTQLRTNLKFMFDETCVRTDRTEPTSFSASVMPESDAHSVTTTRSKTRRGGGGGDGGGPLSSGWVRCSDQELMDVLTDFVSQSPYFRPPTTSDAEHHLVVGLKHTEDGNTYVANSTSRYCLNKASACGTDHGEHSNTRVYFQITRTGICQRCYSAKTYGTTVCSVYHSATQPLPSKIYSRLFSSDCGGLTPRQPPSIRSVRTPSVATTLAKKPRVTPVWKTDSVRDLCIRIGTSLDAGSGEEVVPRQTHNDILPPQSMAWAQHVRRMARIDTVTSLQSSGSQ